MPIDFTAAAQRIIEAAETGLQDAADHIKADAVDRAPKDTGYLRNTGETDQDGLAASIYFEGPYAVRQHEELDWHHQDGEAKYLENAVIDNREEAGAIIAEAIRQAL